MASVMEPSKNQTNAIKLSGNVDKNFMSDANVYYNFTPGSVKTENSQSSAKQSPQSATKNNAKSSKSKLPIINSSELPIPIKRTSFGRVLLRISKENNSSKIQIARPPSPPETVSAATLPATMKHDYSDIINTGQHPSLRREKRHSSRKLVKASSFGNDEISTSSDAKVPNKKKSQMGSGIFSSWRKKKTKDTKASGSNKNYDVVVSPDSSTTVTSENIFSRTQPTDLSNSIQTVSGSSEEITTPFTPRAVSGISWKFNEITHTSAIQQIAEDCNVDNISPINVISVTENKTHELCCSASSHEEGRISSDDSRVSSDIYSKNIDLNLTIDANELSGEESTLPNQIPRQNFEEPSAVQYFSKPVESFTDSNCKKSDATRSLDDDRNENTSEVVLNENITSSDELGISTNFDAVHNMFYPYVENSTGQNWNHLLNTNNQVGSITACHDVNDVCHKSNLAAYSETDSANAVNNTIIADDVELSETTLNENQIERHDTVNLIEDVIIRNDNNEFHQRGAEVDSLLLPARDEADGAIRGINESSSSRTDDDSDVETIPCSEADTILVEDDAWPGGVTTLEEIYSTRYTSKVSYVKTSRVHNDITSEELPSPPIPPRSLATKQHELPPQSFSNSLYLMHHADPASSYNREQLQPAIQRQESGQRSPYLSRIPEVSNYYDAKYNEAACARRSKDSAAGASRTRVPFQEEFRSVNLNCGEFDPNPLDELLAPCSANTLAASQRERKLLHDVRTGVLEWRNKTKWLRAKKRMRDWKKLGK